MAKSNYPCLCLCFLTLQDTRTIPLRLNILQSLHIFFIDARTFMMNELSIFSFWRFLPET